LCHGLVFSAQRSLTRPCTCQSYFSVYLVTGLPHMFIFGSNFHVWEKTCDLCLSEAGLLHLTRGPPIAFIYLQTLWLSKTPLFIFTTFSGSVPQL
jgi:hypothetical protein